MERMRSYPRPNPYRRYRSGQVLSSVMTQAGPSESLGWHSLFMPAGYVISTLRLDVYYRWPAVTTNFSVFVGRVIAFIEAHSRIEYFC